MTTQMLLGEAHARTTDPTTSHQAAREVKPEALSLEQRVLDALSGNPCRGMTSHELVALTGLTWNTVTPRIRPLVKKGLVEDSGMRRNGPTGKKCIVWRAL